MMEKIKLTNLAQEKLSNANMESLLGGDGGVACQPTPGKCGRDVHAFANDILTVMRDQNMPPVAQEVGLE